MKVKFIDLNLLHASIQNELDSSYKRVMESNWFTLGNELLNFESQFASYCGVKYASGVGSGHEALVLSLLACGIGFGDEVIVPGFTFISTWMAVTEVGAVPIPVDININTFNIDINKIRDAVSKKTKAIIPVHLYGRLCEMNDVMMVAEEHGLWVIEDAAQAHGATRNENKAGTFGHLGCFSFYPGKNLGALGDGGAIVTQSIELHNKIQRLRNYGSIEKYVHLEIGKNSRLDEIQAAFLTDKLKYLDKWNLMRREKVKTYFDLLKDLPVNLPDNNDGGHVWHLFTILCKDRDHLLETMKTNQIECGIHYPKSPAESLAYSHALKYKLDDLSASLKAAQETLSLPLHPFITNEEVEYVAQAIRKHYKA